jgi:hypothetical protein
LKKRKRNEPFIPLEYDKLLQEAFTSLHFHDSIVVIYKMIHYLTIQTCCLVLLKAFYGLDFINLHFLTIVVFFGGCYLTYVKEFVIIDRYDVGQQELIISNFPLHILPFLYIWKTYELNKNNLLETYLYLLIYFYVFNPNNIYKLTPQEVKKLSLVFVIGAFIFNVFL